MSCDRVSVGAQLAALQVGDVQSALRSYVEYA